MDLQSTHPYWNRNIELDAQHAAGPCMLHATISSQMIVFLIVDIDSCMFYGNACMRLIAASFPRVRDWNMCGVL